MFSKFCASKHETDVEKALAYGSGSGCAGRHDSVWRRGESIVSESMESVESKQNVYRAVGVSLEEQEAFLLGKQQAEELQELAGEIEESNIRALLQRVAEVYVSRFDHAEKERGNFEFLQTVRADYLPEVEKMARKYIQMEKLDETAKDTFAAEKFGKFLENFPGMDGL